MQIIYQPENLMSSPTALITGLRDRISPRARVFVLWMLYIYIYISSCHLILERSADKEKEKYLLQFQ